jgi:6-phosphogluconolactonase
MKQNGLKTKSTFYVGCYNEDGADGLHQFQCNFLSGEMSLVKSVNSIKNPSFLAINAQKGRLYAVSETIQTEKAEGGQLASFDISDQNLRLMNEQLSYGDAPCFLKLNSAKNILLYVNYGGGNIGLYKLTEDGEIDGSPIIKQHSGSSVNLDRQASAHPHAIITDPTETFALIPDLGLDQIVIYRLDAQTPDFIPHAAASMTPGSGPRHMIFHPSGHFAYVINELDSTITVCSFDIKAGKLQTLQVISTLPEQYFETNYCAGIEISPSGHYLYGSNRGHNSIVTYLIDQASGQLTYIGHTASGGRTPRNFAISPDGTFMLTANQDSDTICSFWINAHTGLPEPTGQSIAVNKPVCIKFLEA